MSTITDFHYLIKACKPLGVVTLMLLSVVGCGGGGGSPEIENSGMEKLSPSGSGGVVLYSDKLNDTGITWGGDYSSGNTAGCSSNIDAPQDCNQGRDAMSVAQLDKLGSGSAGFDFTKIAIDGSILPDSATEWACVQDNHTGLVWEVKTDDGGIHDKDNNYPWGGVSAVGRKADPQFGAYYDDWNSLVNGSIEQMLCGYSDWRVPRREELRSIVDYSRTDPAIDSDFFPNTNSSKFWSSSPDANYSHNAWILNFYSGNDDNYNRRNSLRFKDNYVRLVHSSRSL